MYITYTTYINRGDLMYIATQFQKLMYVVYIVYVVLASGVAICFVVISSCFPFKIFVSFVF